MHLHVSFKDLQPPMLPATTVPHQQQQQTLSPPASSSPAAFSHQETQNNLYAYTWIQTTDSRYAIWHAGQVVHAATDLPAETLGGFYSICLLQATVVLWVYGNLGLASATNAAAARGAANHHRPPRPHPPLLPLNDDNEEQGASTAAAALGAFIDYGEGQPGLRILDPTREVVPLTEPNRVVQTVLDVITQNWQNQHQHQHHQQTHHDGVLFPSGTDEVMRVLGDFCACFSVDGGGREEP
jgi:hypothetical protein